MLILLFGFIWLRATLPRMRYDQFMRFGWKVLIPVNLVWILFLAGVRVANNELSDPRPMAGHRRHRGRRSCWSRCSGRPHASRASSPSRNSWPPRPPGSFPVPPMDLQVPPSPRARRAVAERAPATVGGESDTTKEV